jgi:hypothetical protein
MTPAPIAGGGENQNILTPQGEFNRAYILSKPPAWQPLYNSMGPGAPLAAPLSYADRKALLKSLFAAGARLDPFIEGGAGYCDPFTTMFIRALQGWAWVWPGTGLDTSQEVMGQGNSLPAPPGTIITSTNIADYPPFPVPVVVVIPPAASVKIPNPVGARMFTSLTALGDLFKSLVDKTGNDGYNVTDTWEGTAQGYTGTWTKVAEEAGLMICWMKTA